MREREREHTERQGPEPHSTIPPSRLRFETQFFVRERERASERERVAGVAVGAGRFQCLMRLLPLMLRGPLKQGTNPPAPVRSSYLSFIDVNCKMLFDDHFLFRSTIPDRTRLACSKLRKASPKLFLTDSNRKFWAPPCAPSASEAGKLFVDILLPAERWMVWRLTGEGLRTDF